MRVGDTSIVTESKIYDVVYTRSHRAMLQNEPLFLVCISLCDLSLANIRGEAS